MEQKAIEKYYLFLDESGTFDENEDKYDEECSLVGGVLCKQELADKQVAGRLIEELRNEYIEQIALDPNEKEVDLTFRHATQLPYKIKANAKVSMLEKILTKGYIPVIFQQSKKGLIVK